MEGLGFTCLRLFVDVLWIFPLTRTQKEDAAVCLAVLGYELNPWGTPEHTWSNIQILLAAYKPPASRVPSDFLCFQTSPLAQER